MAAAIKNLTQRPIFVALNSGTELRLSPGETAADIPDVELKDNAKLQKLQQQHAIAVETEGDAEEHGGESEEGAGKRKARGSRT
jgi:hypothetical protein